MGKLSNVARNSKTANLAFHRAMEDDFNTPAALASLFKLLEYYQTTVWELSGENAQTLFHYILTTLSAIGITIKLTSPSATVRELATKRELCRRDKQFAKADALRKKISAVGYSIDDTPLGPLITRRR